jgi:glutathione peroxidase
MADNAYSFSFPALKGGTISLKDFAGKSVLVVNTASKCGLTPQYAGLEALHRAKGGKGLVVLGVPSNDFGGQEPGSEAEVAQFCETNYHVSFPMTAKQQVVGGDAHPFYRWAVETLGADAAPRWNFHKYLIGPKGELVGYFGSKTTPDAAELADAIDKVVV